MGPSVKGFSFSLPSDRQTKITIMLIARFKKKSMGGLERWLSS